VRFLSGYLVLLVAFAFGGEDTGIGRLGVLLASAGLGYFLAAWIAPAVGRYVREEPMVVGALAVMAMAAFIGAQALSLIAAGVLAAAAGFAWGMAKFAFDAMMHATVPTRERGKAFTIAESMFQTAWVMGALIPVLPFWPTELGLSSAGVLALIIQVGYVSLVLVPESVRHHEPSPERAAEPDPDIGILDFI
jgi:MFS family permease